MKKPALFLLFLASLFSFSCKNKKAEEATNFFPVLSFIKSQIAQVDTSVFTIMKIVTVDSVSDTSYLKRNQFRDAAKDFLSLPDISSDKLKDDYVETKMYDADLKQAVLNYMAKNEDVEIKREDVMIQPMTGEDKVSSIFINQLKDNSDSTVQKILFWQVNKSFKVVTSVQKHNKPEKIQTLEVIWNGVPPAE